MPMDRDIALLVAFVVWVIAVLLCWLVGRVVKSERLRRVLLASAIVSGTLVSTAILLLIVWTLWSEKCRL